MHKIDIAVHNKNGFTEVVIVHIPSCVSWIR